MTDTNIIVNLPTALTSILLHNWLDTKAIVTLDSAFCISSARKQFLSLLHITVFQEPLTSVNVKWFAARNLSTSKVIMGRDEQLNLFTAHLSQNGEAVRSVEFVVGALPASVSLVASYCHHLTCVLLHNGDIITPEFRDLLLSNPHLEDLRIVSLRRAEQQKVQDRNTASFKNIRLPCLRSVSIEHIGCRREINLDILAMGDNIEVVNFGSVYVTHSDLCRLAEFCPCLLSLSLAGVPRQVTDEVVAAITAAHPDILHLDLRDAEISDEAIMSVVTNLKGLRSLNISRCAGLRSKSLKYLYTHCAETLQTLYLTSTSEPVFKHEFVAKLLQTCTHLRSLGWLETVEKEDASAYVFTDSVSNLTEIALGWEALCDANLIAISQHCTQLHTLTATVAHESHSADSRQYSLDGFTALVKGCLQLQNVVLNVPLYYGAAPHPLVLPIIQHLKTLQPALNVYWNGSDKRRFRFNVLNMAV